MNKEKDKTKKLAMILAIVNHPENPSDSDEIPVTISESWRGFYRNACLLKHCHDVCHEGDGAAFLEMYAPGNEKLTFPRLMTCRCFVIRPSRI
jgi:hypothetical protein